MYKTLILISGLLLLASCSPRVQQAAASNPGDETAEVADTTPAHPDYAVLYVYRNTLIGALLNFDLHLNDQVLFRMTARSKQAFRIDTEGPVELWAKTEAKSCLPLTIEKGKDYYVRCDMKLGVAVYRPSLKLVDAKQGKAEYESIKDKKR